MIVVVKEFREIKRIVKNRYHHLNTKKVCAAILNNHKENDENICLIDELTLTIEQASSTVECGFSTTNRMLGPPRKS